MMINEITLPAIVHLDFNAWQPRLAMLTEKTWCILNGNLYEISEGFYFNGMSCPRFGWTALGLTPFDPKIIVQVMWHDIIYETHCFGRGVADDLLDSMNEERNRFWDSQNIDCNIRWSQRKLIREGLRVGGWKAYNDATKESIIGASKHLFINGEQYKPCL